MFSDLRAPGAPFGWPLLYGGADRMDQGFGMAAGGYRRWVRDSIERPTEQQMSTFARRLSDHHSWYKHLPLHGTGEPFIIYLAPHIHQAWVEREDGPGGWRSIVANPEQTWIGDRLKVDLRDGDVLPEGFGPVTQEADGLSTEQVWTSMHRFSYWNVGRPSEPASETIARAAAQLRVSGDDGESIAIPEAGLWRGLVHLRGTISPSLGPFEERYEVLRQEHHLPTHEDDRRAQLQAIVAAASAVSAWVYDQP